MDVNIIPHELTGSINAISSKSVAHRLLICASLADKPCTIACTTTSADIMATVSCLCELGARITRTQTGFRVVPIKQRGRHFWTPRAKLDCRESGSTLRFLLPVICALGNNAAISMSGKLPQRPLSPLYEQLIAAGADLSPQGTVPFMVSGSMRAGIFRIPGNVSSQYISSLLMAAPLLADTLQVVVTEPVESRPYVQLTINAMKQFGVAVYTEQTVEFDQKVTIYTVDGSSRYSSPESVYVEGDWSNSAFWLCAAALGGAGIAVNQLNLSSAQGDRSIMAALARFGARISRKGTSALALADHIDGCVLDVADFPDLVPPLAAVAALGTGTTQLIGAGRLRLKESDRLQTVCNGLNALGAHIRIQDDGLIIEGVRQLTGGVVDAANDHRIAMMAAIAATRCTNNVLIRGAQCVNKSYPHFFEDYIQLGGTIEKLEEVQD